MSAPVAGDRIPIRLEIQVRFVRVGKDDRTPPAALRISSQLDGGQLVAFTAALEQLLAPASRIHRV